MNSGMLGRGGAIALAGLVAALTATTPASAAKVDILTPKDGKRLKSGAVSAAVKTSGPRFRAFLDGRDVTRDFSGAKVKRASFTASDVDGADADLFVTAGRGSKLATDHHFFRALRSTPGLISVKTRDGKPAHPAPEIRVRSRGRIALSRILLNGKPVDRFFTDDFDGRGFRGRLGADSGLRFGTNAVTIEVELSNGKFERRGIKVEVDPGDPIAGAGGDRFVGVGETTLLDASASKRSKGKARGSGAAKGGAALSYEWRLTETPAGSEAKLSDATSASPSLVPDIPGSYEAQVLVSQGSSTSADETTVHVPVTADPIGAPIQTITKSGAIQIGDPSSPGATTYERRGNWVQMLVLSPLNVAPVAGNNWDKFTGVPTGQGGVLAFNHGQGQKLLDAVQAAKGQIVILSGQGLNGAIGNDAKELTSAIETLGGTIESGGLTPKGVSDLGSGHWSVIGQVGDAQGSADQSFLTTPAGITGFLGGERGLPGSLTGYVQKVTGTGYQFISPELISIDTKWSPPNTTPSPTTNVIKVGDAEYQESFEYQGQGIVAGESAIQLLVLDANTLAPVANETFRIILPDGQTDFGGVALLAEALHNAVTAPAPASNLVILQDFGSHNGGNWPGGNSTQWVDDSIPDFSRSSNWRGSRYPSKTSDLVKLWNETNQFGSVAGNAGILAGSAGHDLVANYRRPYFEEETGNIVNPVNGGLTMIGLTNAYDRSSVFLQGPTPASADPAAAATSGRIAGVLSRNNQSQLVIGGTTLGAAPAPSASAYDAGAFPQLALQPKTPWPCTPEAPAPCPDEPARSGELVAAMAFITASIVPGATSPDIRQEYNNRAFSTTTPLTLLRDLARPANPEPFFGQDVFDKMKTPIRTELGQIAGIQKGFDAYGGLLDASSTDYSITKASGQAIGALQRLKKNVPALQGFFDVQKIVEYALFGAGQLANLVPGGGGAGGALGFAAYTVEYSRNILDFAGIDTSAKNLVPGEINIVKAEAHELTEIVRRQVDAADNSLAHFEDLIRTDPVKLAQAASNFNGLWSVTTDQIRQLQQGFSIGLQQSFWKAITPQILTQWVIGPGHTDINPGGVQDLPDRGYNCRNLDDNYHLTGFDNPLSNAPASATSMSSVLWTGSSGPSATEIMVRFLKYNAPPNDLQVEAGEFDTEYGDSYVEKKGVSPPALITDPLFATPGAASDPLYPTELGMSKEEFFGLPGWTVRKLQCGKRQ